MLNLQAEPPTPFPRQSANWFKPPLQFFARIEEGSETTSLTHSNSDVSKTDRLFSPVRPRDTSTLRFRVKGRLNLAAIFVLAALPPILKKQI